MPACSLARLKVLTPVRRSARILLAVSEGAGADGGALGGRCGGGSATAVGQWPPGRDRPKQDATSPRPLVKHAGNQAVTQLLEATAYHYAPNAALPASSSKNV
jgi:hypothetical protein